MTVRSRISKRCNRSSPTLPKMNGVLKTCSETCSPILRCRNVPRPTRADWDLIIVSAGSSWYIDLLLQRANVQAVVHSNPGRIVPGRGLVLNMPKTSPFYCPDVGIDKSAVMRHALGSISVSPSREMARRMSRRVCWLITIIDSPAGSSRKSCSGGESVSVHSIDGARWLTRY